MNINDKVYMCGSDGKVWPGVIVAAKWHMNPWPQRWYVVKKVTEANGIADVLKAAFNGSPEELAYLPGRDLVTVPTIQEEAAA